MSARAHSSAVGVGLLVLATLAFAAGVGIALQAVETPSTPPRAGVDLSAAADRDRLALTHLGGDTLDARELRLRVRVDGESLAHQPPIPFFAAHGFESGPTGPFNSAADPRWEPGETASFRLAGTNDPRLEPGARVEVVVYARGHPVARATATA